MMHGQKNIKLCYIMSVKLQYWKISGDQVQQFGQPWHRGS